MKVIPFVLLIFLITSCKQVNKKSEESIFTQEQLRVVKNADVYLKLAPITVTDAICERSAGGKNDFYSEGDYWWPDPENPEGPYIRKDGMTNPENFTAHREAMIRFSQVAGALGSAYLVTEDLKYAKALLPHLKAWFLNTETMMNPNLLYGQAITGLVTGRGIGIIDTIHFMEVVKAIEAILASGVIINSDLDGIKKWFSAYLTWITTHEYGIAERDNGNNHSVCWAMQAAVFASFVHNKEVLDYCKNMYKTVLLPLQMAADGSFPLEIKRTKPYGYSLFNLDAMSTICQVLSTPEENLFEYTVDGKNMKLGLSFLYPYVKDKSKWPFKKDVMYWDEWPVNHPSFLFGGLALKNDAYLDLWQSLKSDFDTPEVIRNMPVRYPLLWISKF